MEYWYENLISAEEARTLDGLFAKRVHRSGPNEAYGYYRRSDKSWHTYSWRQMAREVARWQTALAKESLNSGDRVAIQLRNCPQWVMFDQAAMANGLVTVPLYTDDRAENAAYILREADVKLILVQDLGRWKRLKAALSDEQHSLRRVILLDGGKDGEQFANSDELVVMAVDWLPQEADEYVIRKDADPHSLASIVYTSGTTGRPKGVMLSHHNMLSVAHGGLKVLDCYEQDRFLSFLPLSHTLERTGGYYVPLMAGASVYYARSIAQLAEDLQTIKPSVIIAVPRVFERVYGKLKDQLSGRPAYARWLMKQSLNIGWNRFLRQQGCGSWTLGQLFWPLLDRLVASKIRQKMGGRMRAAISGGAALPEEVGRVFTALGLPLLQGYGLTEMSPIVSVNPLDNNIPASVGIPLRGTKVKIGEHDELLVRGPGVMKGYWNNHAATARMIDADGWLHSGDMARIDEDGHIYITGRLKDILVLSNGEKVPPSDMESAIALDSLIEQVLVIGEGKPYLSALVVLSADHWRTLAQEIDLDPLASVSLTHRKAIAAILIRIKSALTDFPGYAKIRKAVLTLDPWTIEDGLLTPTLKLKRAKITERFAKQVELMYKDGPAD